MGIAGVVVRLTHSSPSADESDGVDGGRCGAPRLRIIWVVELQVFAAVATARAARIYRVFSRTAGDDCRNKV